MKNDTLKALAFAALALLAVVALCLPEAAMLTKFVGKAVWYLPYAAIVGSVKFAIR